MNTDGLMNPVLFINALKNNEIIFVIDREDNINNSQKDVKKSYSLPSSSMISIRSPSMSCPTNCNPFSSKQWTKEGLT